MNAGPHIFDNALAELMEEVEEGAGLLEMEQSVGTDPTPLFGFSMIGANGNALLGRCGFLPTGQPYVRFVGMMAATGTATKVHALETETGAFIETD